MDSKNKDFSWVNDPQDRKELAEAEQKYEENPCIENLYAYWGLNDTIYLKQNPHLLDNQRFYWKSEDTVSVLDSYF